MVGVSGERATATADEQAIELGRRIIWLTTHTCRWAGMRTLRLETCDLSLPQLSVLYWIRYGTATLGYLAQRLMVTPRVITGIVDRLERRAYVRRVNDPVDRRCIRLELTETGRATSVAVEREVAAGMAPIIADLDDAERADLERGLAVLDRILQRLDPAGLGTDNQR